MDLDQLRLKTASQLSDPEKDFIKENNDKLTQEDKDAYASFLAPEENGSSDAGDSGDGRTDAGGTVDNGAGNGGEGGSAAGDGGDGGASGAGAGESAQPPAHVFKTEEEIQAYVKEEIAKNEKEKQAAIDAAATPEEKKYVEDNWKPENWNKGISTIKDIVKKELKEEDEAERVKEVGKKLDAEWEELSKEKNIPALTTKEGREIHSSIINYGRASGKQNFHDAYEVWATVPKKFGGGLETVTAQTDAAAEEKKVVDEKAKKDAAERRAAAGKIEGQNQGAGSVKGAASLSPISYEDLKQPRSKLLKKALSTA